MTSKQESQSYPAASAMLREERRRAADVLDELRHVLVSERSQDYGRALDNFERMASVTNASSTVDMDWLDAAKAMIAMKLARLAANPTHEDSWLDIAGYAVLVLANLRMGRQGDQ